MLVLAGVAFLLDSQRTQHNVAPLVKPFSQLSNKMITCMSNSGSSVFHQPLGAAPAIAHACNHLGYVLATGLDQTGEMLLQQIA